MGIIQLIKRKNFKKVDLHFYALLGLYIAVAATYVFFELVAVNYRPILIDGKAEASYPSSHTMLAITVLLSSFLMICRLVKNRSIKFVALGVTVVCSVAMAILRLYSGVHWATDIIGGILISVSLVLIFNAVLSLLDYLQLKKAENKNSDANDKGSDDLAVQIDIADEQKPQSNAEYITTPINSNKTEKENDINDINNTDDMKSLNDSQK